MGPASLEAVKKGQIGLAYDVGFVLAEVNAGTHLLAKVKSLIGLYVI